MARTHSFPSSMSKRVEPRVGGAVLIICIGSLLVFVIVVYTSADSRSSAQCALPFLSTSDAEDRERMCEIIAKRDVNVNEPVTEVSHRARDASTVLFVWCSGENHRRHFEFRHYLSVLSTLEHLSALNVFFYYDHEPPVDKMHYYYTWLLERAHKLPFFTKRSMPTSSCQQSSTAPTKKFVEQTLTDIGGGIYIDIDVIVVQSATHLLVDLIDITDERSKLKMLRYMDVSIIKNSYNGDTSATVTSVGVSLARLVQLSSTEVISHTTGQASVIAANISLSSVMQVSIFENIMIADHSFFPSDVWELDTELGRQLRIIAYGSPDVISN